MLSQAGRGIVVTELSTSVTGDAGQTLELARELTGAGVQFVSIAPARTRRAQVSAVDIAVHLHHNAGIETIASVTTWDRLDAQVEVFNEHISGVDELVRKLSGFEVIVAMRERAGSAPKCCADCPI